jgi:predicted enzyme related to lactoylglutathione lyase
LIVSDFSRESNRAVWFDIPVVDLERATAFYSAVLAVKVEIASFNDFKFSVIEHQDGNGGCLVPKPDEVSSDKGVMLYLNVHGRIRDAVQIVQDKGGSVLEEVHSIGPHGFRAIILDSEGNRMVLHSDDDA